MKNLLIICDNFPPQSGPRMGYLVKYAKRLGWNSYVVAAENKSRNDLTGLSGYAEETHIIPQKPHRKWNLLHMLTFFWPYDYLRGEYDMRRVALDLAARVKFDIIICSHTYGWFPVNTAWAVANKTHLPLVIDIRDLMAQEQKTTFFEKSFSQKMDWLRSQCSFISRCRVAWIHRRAAALTTISPWHAEWLMARWNKNTVCIYNGFDPELFKPLVPIKSSRFEIVYAGTLATRRQRNPELLLQAVKRLAESGRISPRTLVMQFFGERPENHVVLRARELGVEKFIEVYPSIPITKLPSIFARASMLLLLGARSGPRGTHGIMTTKFFEYLAANRPIMCVPSDEDCLETAIHETKSGYAPRSVDEAEDYLYTLYREWVANGVTAGNTCLDKLSIFSRKTQAMQFVELFDTILRRVEK